LNNKTKIRTNKCGALAPDSTLSHISIDEIKELTRVTRELLKK
jgi:hypothetical protein